MYKCNVISSFLSCKNNFTSNPGHLCQAPANSFPTRQKKSTSFSQKAKKNQNRVSENVKIWNITKWVFLKWRIKDPWYINNFHVSKAHFYAKRTEWAKDKLWRTKEAIWRENCASSGVRRIGWVTRRTRQARRIGSATTVLKLLLHGA